MNTSILATGFSGLIGSRVNQLLSDTFSFQDISYTSGVDITQYEQVRQRFAATKAETVVHMAAKTDVDGCEDDKLLGEEGDAWRINVFGTQNIIDAAKQFGKKVVYISTDFVFDGTKKESYTEDDEPDPINWYAVTKHEGEKIVMNSGVGNVIVRLAYPYRAQFAPKLDFVRRIIEKAQKKEKIFSLTDHIFTPTYIDDIASALQAILSANLQGIFHVVGSQSLTPQQAIEKIFATFDLQTEVIPITREIYFKNRAFRPCRLALSNDKITKSGVKMQSFDEGLSQMKKNINPSRLAFH